jgi:hypothetical protein
MKKEKLKKNKCQVDAGMVKVCRGHFTVVGGLGGVGRDAPVLKQKHRFNLAPCCMEFTFGRRRRRRRRRR